MIKSTKKIRFIFAGIMGAFTLLGIISIVSSCSNKTKTEKLTVFCAASLTDVISEITSEFEKEQNIQVKLNFASSGTLARQIEHGANPDIYVSANKEWIDYLDELELIVPETEKKVAGNSMVLIAPLKSNIEAFAFFSGVNFTNLFQGRLSIGDPQHVPAGKFAIQILENLGVKEEMKSRILPAKDVRSALMVVELGEVEAGIVYKTDAQKSKKIKIITEFPDSLHRPVHYYMVIINGQKNEKSLTLYNYIFSDEAKQIWKENGFLP